MTAMKWWGWGHEHVAFTHEDKPELAPFIRKELDVDIERPTARPIAFEDVEVAEPNLPDDLRAELEISCATAAATSAACPTPSCGRPASPRSRLSSARR